MEAFHQTLASTCCHTVLLLCTCGVANHCCFVSIQVPQRAELQQEFRAETGEIQGSWGAWGTWSDCSQTCGKGVQEQSRPCLPVYNPSQYHSRKGGVQPQQPVHVISALRQTIPLHRPSNSSEIRKEIRPGGRRYCIIYDDQFQFLLLYNFSERRLIFTPHSQSLCANREWKRQIAVFWWMILGLLSFIKPLWHTETFIVGAVRSYNDVSTIDHIQDVYHISGERQQQRFWWSFYHVPWPIHMKNLQLFELHLERQKYWVYFWPKQFWWCLELMGPQWGPQWDPQWDPNNTCWSFPLICGFSHKIT